MLHLSHGIATMHPYGWFGCFKSEIVRKTENCIPSLFTFWFYRIMEFKGEIFLTLETYGQLQCQKLRSNIVSV